MDGKDGGPPYFIAMATYLSWMILFMFGHARDFFRKLFFKSTCREGYAPIRQDYEDFYTRRMYYRIHDCWNRPIGSAPTSWFDVLERTPVAGDKPIETTGEKRHCLNLGSYNYLGFAASDAYCTPRVMDALEKFGWGTSSSRTEAGTTEKHVELEELVAEYLGVEKAVTFGMGFATNSFTIPALVSKGCLVLSDALNHSSIVAGVRASGATVRVFRHNDVTHLEQQLRKLIVQGQPRTHRPWKKILIIVEGIYSMEGEICNLKEIVEVKKKYNAYLYLDEAHSIGAMGRNGKGICEHAGVNPRDVDVMMGTFTKSFGSCGGYIAGSSDLVDHVTRISPGHKYAASMSPACVEQIISALNLIMGRANSTRGTEKIMALHDNSNYFRAKLLEMGMDVLGDWDSPVMPIMMYAPGKIASLSRACLDRNIGLVVVGFPATTLLTARARVCISASHTREDLDFALEVLEEMADTFGLRYRPMQVNSKLSAEMDDDDNVMLKADKI